MIFGRVFVVIGPFGRIEGVFTTRLGAETYAAGIPRFRIEEERAA